MLSGHIKSSFKELFKDSKPFRLPKGQIIIHADETPRNVYYIVSGYVKTYNISSEGNYQIVDITGAGNIFPLYWALDSLPRGIFYESLTSLKVKALPKEDFQLAVFGSTHYMKVAIDSLLKSYNAMQERVHNLEFRTASQKVVYRLINLGQHFGKFDGKSIEIMMPINYQDIADTLNITRDTANRIMLDLIKEGLAYRKGSKIVLNDIDRLKDILEIR